MEIFSCYEDFIGNTETDELNKSFRELLELVAKTRVDLGRRGDLLDQYLKMLLSGLSAGHIFSISERGFYENARLRNLVRETLRQNMGSHCAHPLYVTVDACIRQNPLPALDENTKVSLYMAALAGDFLDHIIREQRDAQMSVIRQRVDIKCLIALRMELCEKLGEKPVERIEMLLRDRFQTVSYTQMLVQSASDYLSYTLISRDVETSRTVLELCLPDNLSAVAQYMSEVRYNG